MTNSLNPKRTGNSLTLDTRQVWPDSSAGSPSLPESSPCSLTASSHPQVVSLLQPGAERPPEQRLGANTWKNHLTTRQKCKRNPKGHLPWFPASTLSVLPLLSPPQLPTRPSPDPKNSPNPVQIDYFIDSLHTEAFRKGRGLRGQLLTGPPTLVLHFDQSQSLGPDA